MLKRGKLKTRAEGTVGRGRVDCGVKRGLITPVDTSDKYLVLFSYLEPSIPATSSGPRRVAGARGPPRLSLPKKQRVRAVWTVSVICANDLISQHLLCREHALMTLISHSPDYPGGWALRDLSRKT